ncbi:MAG: hypothetical protein NVS1B13_01960 [Flavisolibacter sp.]
MRKLLAIISVFFFVQSGFSQEEFIVPSRLITKINFTQFSGGVIVLQGTLDNYADSLNFILDSGSGGISLDSTTCSFFKLKAIASNKTIRGIGGVKNVSFLYNHILHLPGLQVDSLDFHINNYNVLDAVYGERIDGIIGYSVLSRYIIKIDYDSMKMEFWSRGNIKYPRGGFILKPSINTLPVYGAKIRDGHALNARFLLDMGAGLNMMLSSDFIRDSSLLNKKRKFFAKEAEGLGGKVAMQITVIKELKLGPYKFKNVPIHVFDDTYNVTSYPFLAGLIGNDILRRFNIILNYEKRDFYLLPNSHFYEPFDYSYSGIELFYENGRVIIGDVAPKSPADVAGLREGDIVISVNKNFSQNLQQYKLAIQTTGDRLKIIITRQGELKEFSLKVKSIL